MKINYLAPVFDSSGYAEFARNFIAALHALGEDVYVEPVTFEKQKVDHGVLGKLCKELSAKKGKPDINIINNLPIFFEKHRKPGCKNVGFTMFETSQIPNNWVTACNKMDAIFVPCSWNKKIFKDSGVKVPIYVVQPGIDTKLYGDIDTTSIKTEEEYKFYSIFTWNERKNPIGLIKSYWHAFAGRTDVSLTLKTYMGTSGDMGRQHIVKEIQDLRSQMRLEQYPKMILVNRLLTREEMLQLHLSSDCFVLPHRGEGWGMPLMEAMALDRPCITTGFSGNMDFMSKDNSYLIDYQMTPVCKMPWIGFYDGTMLWADPNQKQLADKMKYVVDNPEEVKIKTDLARKEVLKNFDWTMCGKNLVNCIEQVLSA